MFVADRGRAKRVAVLPGKAMTTERKPPRVVLLELMKRSGLSGTAIATAAGYSSGSGFYRLTQKSVQGDKPISHESIVRLIPVLRGRGTPPITTEELLAISSAANPADTAGTSRTVVKILGAALTETLHMASTGGVLQVTVRVEDGVYTDPDKARSYGPAPIVSSPVFQPSAQFAAVIVDDSAEPVYSKGTVLHLVRPSEFAPATLTGRRVVVHSVAAGSQLVTPVVATVHRVDDTGPVMHAPGTNSPVNGLVVGVVIGHYRRE